MLKTIIKGFIIGSSMMIPGVSGGSMAMILGEYDRLIASVPALFSRRTFKESFKYLFFFTLSALIAIILVARPLEILINRYRVVIMYLFLGAVCASIPMMLKKANTEGFDLPGLLYIVIGILVVFAIDFIPENIFAPRLDASIASILIQVLGGILVSAGLILPGISTSYLLLVLGLYEPVISALSRGEILALIPISSGLVAGILVLTKCLERAMKRYPKITYMIILGFLLGSVREIYPGLAKRHYQIIISIILFLLGFILVYKLSRIEEDAENKQNYVHSEAPEK